MKNYTRLYSDILFYTKELERIENELKLAKSSSISDNALMRIQRDLKYVKCKLDELISEIPEENNSKSAKNS